MKLVWKIVLLLLVWSLMSAFAYFSYTGVKSKNQLILDMDDPTKWTLVSKGATITQSAHEATHASRSHQYGKATDWYRTEYTSVDMTYYPIIIYKYTVDGKEYTGTTISPDGRHAFGNLQDVMVYLDKYPINSKVDFLYQIGNPGHSYLTKGKKSSVFMALLFITLITIVFTAIIMIRY